MSLQECLASRKDCAGGGLTLELTEVINICKTVQQADPLKTLFVILPDGTNYKGGIYKYEKEDFTLLTEKEKTSHIMELYPGVNWKENIELKDLISIGLIWQYLSLKAGSIGLGVSQRARPPKKVNKIVNSLTNQNYSFIYSVAVQKRDHDYLLEDSSEPFRIELEKGIYVLDTPECYKHRAIYNKNYKGVALEDAIFEKVNKKQSVDTTFNDLSQLLWACQGENDHSTHGNRDPLEKNGFARVTASGCAGYAVYPLVFVDNLTNLPNGAYIYNPIGFSALNRWIYLMTESLEYDHYLENYSSYNFKEEIEKEFKIKFCKYVILLCVDRQKPCSGFMHSKLGKMFMNTQYWAEIEAGMALAGLQLQANASGLQWQKSIISNPDEIKYRTSFNLELAELKINEIASKIMNLAKNEKFSLKECLVPIALFSLI
ncbi:MAG: hypothetical protein ACFE8V_09785 [Promethearchaeota archaeon]